jgi:hypothetical protein
MVSVKVMIVAYSYTHTKPINLNTFCEQNSEILNVKAVSTYSYHWSFKG